MQFLLFCQLYRSRRINRICKKNLCHYFISLGGEGGRKKPCVIRIVYRLYEWRTYLQRNLNTLCKLSLPRSLGLAVCYQQATRLLNKLNTNSSVASFFVKSFLFSLHFGTTWLNDTVYMHYHSGKSLTILWCGPGVLAKSIRLNEIKIIPWAPSVLCVFILLLPGEKMFHIVCIT